MSEEPPFEFDTKKNTEPLSLETALYDKIKSHISIDATADKALIEESINNEVKYIINDHLNDTMPINLQPSISKLNVLLNLMRASRSYNLDLTPKLLSCNGELVEILIRSGVGRYLEFKGVDDIGIYDSNEGRLDRVRSLN